MTHRLDEAIDNVRAAERYLRSIGESWYADLLSDAIDMMECNGWISVQEHLPQSGRRYLTIGPNGVMRVAKACVPAQEVPNWQGSPDYHWWKCEGRHCAAAYYMPLPAPPKEEAK